MDVGNNNQVVFDRLHAAFPYVSKPQYAFTDFIGEFGLAQQTTTDMETGDVQVMSRDMVFDPIMECAYARPVGVYHVNVIWRGPQGYRYYKESSPYQDLYLHYDYSGYYPDYRSDCYRTNRNNFYKWTSNFGFGDVPLVIWQVDYNNNCDANDFQQSNTGVPASIINEGGTFESNFRQFTDRYFWQNFSHSTTLGFTAPTSAVNGTLPNASSGENPRPDPIGINAQATARVCCQGFSATFTAQLINSITVPSFAAFRWRVSVQGSQSHKWYSLSTRAGFPLTLAYSNDGANYTVIKEFINGTGFELTGPGPTSTPPMGFLNIVDTPLGAPLDPTSIKARQSAVEFNRTVAFSVLFIGGKMKISFAGSTALVDVPFVWSDPRFDGDTGLPAWTIDTVQVAFNEFSQGTWRVSPIKFATTAQMVSNDQNIGFVPDSEPNWRVHYAPQVKGADSPTSDEIGFSPDGCTGTAQTYDINGTTIRYLLTIDNNSADPAGTFLGTPYADYTAAVRAVSAFYQPETVHVNSNPLVVQPIRIAVHYEFDFSSLRVSSRAELTFENYNGYWSNAFDGGWVEQNGHVAVAIDMGIEGFSRYRRLTGIANTAFSERMGTGGASEVTIQCQDTWLPLDTPVWNLPWMDGWNVYYMMFYLASHRGVSADRMQFYIDGFVPSTPYGPCPNGQPAYYMPVGPAGTPLTRFGGGQMISEIMRKVAFSLGYILFFDVNGVLQFYKFQPTNPGPWKQTFTYVPQAEGSGKLTEIWGGQYDGRMCDVRNQVTIVGVNAFGPIWNPLVFHASDDGSILDDTQFNFLGYPNPLVWMDNIFVDPVFAQNAVNSLLGFMRIPTRNVQLTTWMQPDTPIYPLDIIQVYNPKSAASFGAKDFLVVSVTDIQEYGEAPTTHLSGRWLPPEWLQQATQGTGPPLPPGHIGVIPPIPPTGSSVAIRGPGNPSITNPPIGSF